MKEKKSLEKQTRGWLPNYPLLLTINNTRYSRKLEKWVANPFATLGTITIVASLLSVIFGTTLVSAYLPLPNEPKLSSCIQVSMRES